MVKFWDEERAPPHPDGPSSCTSTWCGVWGLGFGVWCLGFGVSLGCREGVLGFGVCGVGFGVWGLKFGV